MARLISPAAKKGRTTASRNPGPRWAFVPLQGCTQKDWCGFWDENSGSWTGVSIDLDEESDELQASLEHVDQKFTLTATRFSNTRKISFLSLVPTDDPFYDDVKAGALDFTLVLGTAFGKRVIKWNGFYDGKGGMIMGEYVPPVDHFLELRTELGNFWKFFTTPKRKRDKHGSFSQFPWSLCTCAKRNSNSSKRSLARTITSKILKRKSTRPQKKKRL